MDIRISQWTGFCFYDRLIAGCKAFTLRLLIVVVRGQPEHLALHSQQILQLLPSSTSIVSCCYGSDLHLDQQKNAPRVYNVLSLNCCVDKNTAFCRRIAVHCDRWILCNLQSNCIFQGPQMNYPGLIRHYNTEAHAVIRGEKCCSIVVFAQLQGVINYYRGHMSISSTLSSEGLKQGSLLLRHVLSRGSLVLPFSCVLGYLCYDVYMQHNVFLNCFRHQSPIHFKH